MRQTVIAGNWKMNATVPETENLLASLLDKNPTEKNVQIVVCPPFTSLYIAGKILDDSHIALGAQDMSPHQKGAFTSEISAEMLLTVGVRFVILGHSERRQYHAETDQLVNAKTKTALKANLTPIICVGETLAEREANQTFDVIGNQIDGCLSDLTADDIKQSIIAYEPVWAIGTGKTATPEMAQEVHAFIRSKLAARDNSAAQVTPILYGGSVKPDNAAELLAQVDIDGALVGGAALKADDFTAIINAV